MRGSRLLGLALFAALAGVGAGAATAPAPGGTVVVEISGLRSTDGQVLACLTARATSFPDCARDPDARFGPPKFAAAAYGVGADEISIPIRMRYLF